MNKVNQHQTNTLLNQLSKPEYQGKHIVAIKDKIFTANTGPEASKILKRVVSKYPKYKPTITYIPKEGSLILVVK